MSDTEFQKGYKKALEDLKAQLKDKKSLTEKDLETFLESYKQEQKKQIRPTIYFTKIDKKGNLEADWEKTRYYAEHPEELANIKHEQPKTKQAPEPDIPTLVRVPQNSKDFLNAINAIGTMKKTPEMCKAENALIYQDVPLPEGLLDKVKEMPDHERYLNALGNQLIWLSQSPVTLKALENLMGEIKDNGLADILVELIKNRELLQFEDALEVEKC